MTGPLRTKEWRRALSTFKSSLSSKDIRNRFLEYFVNENGHQHVKSSPVIPHFDSSIPFVNAGMCQFKRIFTSQEPISFDKAANSQKCIRIAGKHNDLRAVGIDSYHHTFFEMLGNWSFGSYDKKQACKLAWELLTSPPYNISPHKLFVTYFGGDASLDLPADDEVREFWLELGVRPDHIIPFGASENFWDMGATGPCGTCTEIHVALADHLCSSPHLVNKNNPLLRELWNIVFIKYNRTADGTIEALPHEFIDTGMGFERLVALLQKKTSNYDTDLFIPLFQCISSITRARPYKGTFGIDNIDSSYRTLADYSRMLTVAISDDVFPDVNPKLKRIIRKALFIAEKKFKFTFPHLLVSELSNGVAQTLESAYPEIRTKLNQVQRVLDNEYKQMQFLEKNSRQQWDEAISRYPVLKNFSFIEYPGLPVGYHFLMEQINAYKYKDFLPPELIVNLYMSHGLEDSVIDELLKPLGFKYNAEEVNELLQKMKNISKIHQQEDDSGITKSSSGRTLVTDDSFKYAFKENSERSRIMYTFPDVNATILATIYDNKISGDVDKRLEEEILKLLNIQSGKNVHSRKLGIITDKTNFYTTAGGQYHDTGIVKLTNSNGVCLSVDGVVKLKDAVVHFCDFSQVQGEEASLPCKVGDHVTLKIDQNRRCQIMRNHTAAHLLNAAVKAVFPVSHFRSASINEEMISSTFAVYGYSYDMDYYKLEHYVKMYITEELPVDRFTSSNTLEVMNLPGITFTPGEKYNPENIHVISILDQKGKVISRELCCGTHLNNTKYIQEFCVTKLSFSKAQSTLIVEAVTGEKAENARKYGNKTNVKSVNLTMKVREMLGQNLASIHEMVKAYEDICALLYEIKYNKDIVKDTLPCSITDDFAKLRDAQKKTNKVVTSLPREIVALGLITILNEKYEECDVIAHFFALKHEALRDNNFLLDLVTIREEVTKQKHPVLFVTYVDGKMRCFAYIPEEKITENFNAFTWLSSILENSKKIGVFGSGDLRFAYSLPKQIPEEKVLPTVESILKKASCTGLN